MRYIWFAVIAAIGLVVLMLIYLNKISDGDMPAFTRKIQGMTAEVNEMRRAARSLHGGETCPQQRRTIFLRVRRCADCETQLKEFRRRAFVILRQLPKPLIAIGYIAYFSRWFIEGSQRPRT